RVHPRRGAAVQRQRRELQRLVPGAAARPALPAPGRPAARAVPAAGGGQHPACPPAAEYAIRLLRQRYAQEQGEQIARRLVELYPEHGFIIDHDELDQLGLEVELPTGRLDDIIESLRSDVDQFTVVGRIREVGVP